MPNPRAILALILAASVSAQAQSSHWSYQRVERPALPAVRELARALQPLDRFVMARLDREGLALAPAAERATWLRRASLDLCGLPPSPEALAQFLGDTSEAAFERAVDRLLATPAFGERWAQRWLDLARYADSQGYEKDDLRPDAWRYRDWVIDAFARDLPFDQFTIEQIAGDLLPDPTPDQLVATAFHRQTMTNTEGGTDDEEFRTDAVLDRTNTTLSVWMGSTVGCAQCHDHKFDPISQKEYYRLYAFFDQTEDYDQGDERPTLRVPSAAQRARSSALRAELETVRKTLQPDPAAVAAWANPWRERIAALAKASVRISAWHELAPLRGKSFDDAFDHAWSPEQGVSLASEQDGMRWQERADLVDGKVHTWQGDNSAFYLHRTIHADQAAVAVLSLGSDDAIRVRWNGKEVLAKKTSRAAAPDQELVEVTLQAGDNDLLLKVVNGGGIGGFYFQLRATPMGAAVESALQKPVASCSEAELAAIRDAYVRAAPELATARAEVARLEGELEALRGPSVPILRELPPDRRRMTRIHLRGSFLTQGEPVAPGVPACWPGLPVGAPANRLGLARWLVSRDNPLTARVQVNRFWEDLFGRGLVLTSEEFGKQGEPPQHRELLDWLAVDFMENGWSVQRLLRSIVLSATYRQSSAVSRELLERDPYNDLLARGPNFRLPGEVLRDQALAVSGLLSAKIGGPSVMPAQPDGIWVQMYSGAQWIQSQGEDRHRRSLYTFWRRTSPHPAMVTFEAPSREFCVLRRVRTNTPLQALVTWNDPQFVECAQALAARTLRAGAAGDDAGLVERMVHFALGRPPEPAERNRLQQLVRDERARLAASPADAALLAGPGDAATAVERAALTLCANVLLNLDEFVTKG